MKRGSWLRSEQGLQTLEWVALGLVILALMAAVAFFLTYRASESTGRTVTETVEALFECVQQLDFDCARDVLSAEGGRPEPPRDLIWCITHPLDCWREVVWPGIQKGAKWVWDRLVEVGRAIHQGAARVWDWLKKQWDTWLKGALAGLLAAIVIIIGLIVLVKIGLVAIGVAVVAGVLALIACLIAGIVSQMNGGGFWECFKNALALGVLVAGLIISGGTAISKGLVVEWLKSGFVPTLISLVLDSFFNFNDLLNALQKGNLSAMGAWALQRVVNAAFTYVTSLAAWGLMQHLLPTWKLARQYTPSEIVRRLGWLYLTPLIKQTITSSIAITLINISGIYLTGVLTGHPPEAGEYIAVSLFTILLWFVPPIVQAAGIPELIVESVNQGAQKLLGNWITSRLKR